MSSLYLNFNEQEDTKTRRLNKAWMKIEQEEAFCCSKKKKQKKTQNEIINNVEQWFIGLQLFFGCSKSWILQQFNYFTFLLPFLVVIENLMKFNSWHFLTYDIRNYFPRELEAADSCQLFLIATELADSFQFIYIFNYKCQRVNVKNIRLISCCVFYERV